MVRMYLLTGDIGGTNSRMALYDTCTVNESCCEDKPLIEKYYRNAEHIAPECHSDPDAFQKSIVIPFIKYCWEKQNNVQLEDLQTSQIIATLATAGLVANNRVEITNLNGLLVDGTAIANNLTDPYLKHVVVCRIINDFVAQGYGCLTLKQEEVRPLYGTVSKLDELPVGPKCCLGAGTGLGECYLTPNDDGGTYTCYPSEGGHVEYAPRNDLEVEMFKYLLNKFKGTNRISVERVVSGVGLANVYEFLAQKYPNRIEKAVHKEFLEAGDEQGRVVATNAKPGSLCYQAMEIMMSAYGCETGSAAIKWIPTGGLFLTGGLTPKNIGFIEGLDTDFMKAYTNKGRLSPLLERVPLFAVMTEDLGVRGAHKAALMVYKQYMDEKNGSRQNHEKAFVKFFNENSLMLVAAMALGFTIGMTMSKRF